MTNPIFNIAYIKLCTELEGPFKRCCIWFQGCDIHCKGCCNFELQALRPNHIVSMDKLLEIIMKAKSDFDIEGVTLSGGEPTMQLGLPLLCKKIHELGLGIIMFSGKYIDNIDIEIVKNVDILIDGPYKEEEKDDDRLLIGSKNKHLRAITDRYKDKLEYFDTNTSREEICISNDIFINGD